MSSLKRSKGYDDAASVISQPIPASKYAAKLAKQRLDYLAAEGQAREILDHIVDQGPTKVPLNQDQPLAPGKAECMVCHKRVKAGEGLRAHMKDVHSVWGEV